MPYSPDFSMGYIVESGGYDLRLWWSHHRTRKDQHFGTAYSVRMRWFDHLGRYLERRAHGDVHVHR